MNSEFIIDPQDPFAAFSMQLGMNRAHGTSRLQSFTLVQAREVLL